MTADLLAFIDASPSPFHACANAAARLDGAGFTRVEEVDAWPAGPGGRYLIRDGSLVAWSVPDGSAPDTPFRIVGAHTDSPNLRIKPRPDTGQAGARQLEVEIYGGPLLNSWLDRDLGLSGRVALRGEGQASGELRLLLVDRPVLRVPQLAIHLDRDIMTSGLLLNPQQHLTPMWGIGAAEPDGFVRFLAVELGVDAEEIRFWDVMTHDLQPS